MMEKERGQQGSCLPTGNAGSDEASLALLDQAVLDELRELGGEDDPTFLDSVLQQFLEDAPKHLGRIRLALAEQQAEELANAAHAFKGSSKNVGAVRVAALCLLLENHGRQGSTRGGEGYAKDLMAAWERTREALVSMMASEKSER